MRSRCYVEEAEELTYVLAAPADDVNSTNAVLADNYLLMVDAVAAGDGTLHGAIDYWQGVAADANSDAHRLALELECLLLSTDNPAASKWWDSAHEALELHRQRMREVV